MISWNGIGECRDRRVADENFECMFIVHRIESSVAGESRAERSIAQMSKDIAAVVSI